MEKQYGEVLLKSYSDKTKAVFSNSKLDVVKVLAVRYIPLQIRQKAGIYGLKLMHNLAPSPELTKELHNAQKDTLWSKTVFNLKYKSRIKAEYATDPKKVEALQEVISIITSGKNVIIFTFAGKDKANTSYRVVLKEVLEELNIKVTLR